MEDHTPKRLIKPPCRGPRRPQITTETDAVSKNAILRWALNVSKQHTWERVICRHEKGETVQFLRERSASKWHFCRRFDAVASATDRNIRIKAIQSEWPTPAGLFISESSDLFAIFMLFKSRLSESFENALHVSSVNISVAVAVARNAGMWGDSCVVRHLTEFTGLQY